MGKTSNTRILNLLRRRELAFDPNVEACQTIIQCFDQSWGLYFVDALTENQGWLRMVAVECDEDEREKIVKHFVPPQLWVSPRGAGIIGVGPKYIKYTAEQTHLVASTGGVEPSEGSIADWVLSPGEILRRLEDETTSEKDRLTAVLFAEVTAFAQDQKPLLLRALIEFSEQHRFSNDEEITTAVGAAIRKFAINMPTCEFEAFSQLFLPTETDTLSCEIELELAKAVGWRLAKVDKIAVGEFPNLEARLSELASDYLAARLILQENYASIVVHAVIAIALLNGSRQDEFVDRIAKLRIDWFSDLLGRRLLDVTRKRNAAALADSGNIARLRERLFATCR